MTLRVFLPCVAALVLSLTPTRATAISEYITRIHATLTLEGPSAEDVIVVLDVAEHVTTDDRGSDFPSFSAFNGSASYDDATHTLTVIAETNGAANFAGGIPVAVASGMTRTRGTLGLINPSEDIGFFIDVRIQASFEYTGVLSHPAEFAETIFALDFAGSRLSGLPPDGTLVPPLRTSTEDPGFENGFDLVTSTAFLAVDETYSVLIPPGGSGFVIHDLGFLAQAGGAAASRSTRIAVPDQHWRRVAWLHCNLPRHDGWKAHWPDLGVASHRRVRPAGGLRGGRPDRRPAGARYGARRR